MQEEKAELEKRKKRLKIPTWKRIGKKTCLNDQNFSLFQTGDACTGEMNS